MLVQGLAGWMLGSGPMSAGHADARRIRLSAGHAAARLQNKAHATGAEICARTVSRVPARPVGWRGLYSHRLARSVGIAGLENCLLLCAGPLINQKYIYINILPIALLFCCLSYVFTSFLYTYFSMVLVNKRFSSEFNLC